MGIFAFRRNNKKPDRKGRRLLFWGAVLILLSSILFFYADWRGALSAADQTLNAFLAHDYFSVREIKVRGGEKVGGSEIIAMAALSHGLSIWKVDPAAIERRVGEHPWVRRVLARREFPRRVVIEVEEREVKAIAVLERLYYVDTEGFIFKEVEEGERVDFPLITGLQQADVGSPAALSSREKVREALRLTDLMGKESFALSEIRFLPQGGLVLYSMDYPVALHMGWGSWQEKIQRLKRVLALWQGKEDRLAALDLSFRDQVVAKMRRVEGLTGSRVKG